jgi:hypothetical protein
MTEHTELIARLRAWHKDASLYGDPERVALIAEAAAALEAQSVPDCDHDWTALDAANGAFVCTKCRRLRDAAPKVEPQAQDARDAERYRWLRRNQCWPDRESDRLRDEGYNGTNAELLDAAIDAALGNKKEQA